MKRLVLIFLLLAPIGFPTDASAGKSDRPDSPPVPSLSFDQYGVNFTRYNDCHPQIEFSAQFLNTTPALICLIDGHREVGENQTTSRRRAESARNLLIAYGVEPDRILIRDRGTEKTDRPLQMGSFDRDFNRRIVITFLKRFLATDPKAKLQPNYVFDYHGQKNRFRYDTCYPVLYMAGAELKQNPALFCLLEGSRSADEGEWVSRLRTENAQTYLVEFMNLPQDHIILRDGGKGPKSSRTEPTEARKKHRVLAISILEPVELHNWKSAVPFREDRHDPADVVPRPFLGHINRFIAIGLFHPVAFTGLQ